MIFRYPCDTGLQSAWVEISDKSITIGMTSDLIQSRKDVTLCLQQVKDYGDFQDGLMLSTGERGIAKDRTDWIDLKSSANQSQLSIPEFISRLGMDSYPTRILIPHISIQSMRSAQVMLFMRDKAPLITNEHVQVVRGPLKSRALLDALVTDYRTHVTEFATPLVQERKNGNQTSLVHACHAGVHPIA